MVFPHPGGDERDQGQAEEKEQVGPQDVAVHPLDGVQQVVVVVPVDADEGEAEQVAQEHGDQRRSAARSAPGGTLSSSTMMVMMMAITPSLNASRRPLPILHRSYRYSSP